MAGPELIDPEHEYPLGEFTITERLALRVLEKVTDASVSRTRDVIQIDIGGDDGCVLIVTAEAVEIRLPTLEWTGGAYAPKQSSRLWKRIRTGRMSDMRIVSLIQQAIAARQSEFRQCSFCGQTLPPEHMSDDACHSCSSKHRGVVY